MNAVLYKQMVKVNLQGFMNFAIGSAFYILIMFWLYPGIAQNAGVIDQLVAAMPEGFGRAFGLTGFSTAESFISAEYYGLILLLILAVMCVQLSTQLMAKLVDQGAMAYLLSTPTTRGKIAFTQAAVMMTGLLLVLALTTIAGFVGKAWFLGGEYEFHVDRFVQLNVMVFLLFFAVGGISFLVSTLANDEKKARGISGLIVFLFFSMDLLGKFSDQIDWIRRASLFSLYDPGEIVTGGADLTWPVMVLAAVGLVAYGLSIALFSRRDLPL